MADLPEPLRRLLRESAAPTPCADARTLSTPALVAYLVQHDHDAVREVLRSARGLSVRVARVHGARDPRLGSLADLVCELDDALWAHLDDEEAALFDTVSAARPDVEAARAQLLVMQREHAALVQQLARVRAAADDFATPAWACSSYVRLFELLPRLEARVREHIDLEEGVLLPRFVAE